MVLTTFFFLAFAVPTRVYSYSVDMQTWVELGDAESYVFRRSAHHSSLPISTAASTYGESGDVESGQTLSGPLATAQMLLHGVVCTYNIPYPSTRSPFKRWNSYLAIELYHFLVRCQMIA